MPHLVDQRISNTPSNKAEKAAHAYLSKQLRRVIPVGCVTAFFEEVQQEIDRLSAQHPRCKALQIEEDDFDVPKVVEYVEGEERPRFSPIGRDTGGMLDFTLTVGNYGLKLLWFPEIEVNIDEQIKRLWDARGVKQGETPDTEKP